MLAKTISIHKHKHTYSLTEHNYTAGRQWLKMKLLADAFELEHFCNNSSFKCHYFTGLQKKCNIYPFLEESTLSVMKFICRSTCERTEWGTWNSGKVEWEGRGNGLKHNDWICNIYKKFLSTPKCSWKHISDLWFSVCLCCLHITDMNKKYMTWIPIKQQESHWSRTNIMDLPFMRNMKVQNHSFATDLHRTLLGWSCSKSKANQTTDIWWLTNQNKEASGPRRRR